MAEKLRRATPHWMRHTHATHLLEGGAELTTVRDNLRHASLATSSMYLHADNERRGAQVAAASAAACHGCRPSSRYWSRHALLELLNVLESRRATKRCTVPNCSVLSASTISSRRHAAAPCGPDLMHRPALDESVRFGHGCRRPAPCSGGFSPRCVHPRSRRCQDCAPTLIAGIETMHMVKKAQRDCPKGEALSAADHFYSLA